MAGIYEYIETLPASLQMLAKLRFGLNDEHRVWTAFETSEELNRLGHLVPSKSGRKQTTFTPEKVRQYGKRILHDISRTLRPE
jgi:hypothetical protein